MKLLYNKSVARLLKELQVNENDKLIGIEGLNKAIIGRYGSTLKAKDMVRLPDTELRALLKIPCPTSFLTND